MRYKKPEETRREAAYNSSLRLDMPVAAYARQSTAKQVGNESTAIQTVDLPALLKRYGWPEDKIILVDADQGVSGRLAIDEREGMRHVYELITVEQITAAVTFDALPQDSFMFVTPWDDDQP